MGRIEDQSRHATGPLRSAIEAGEARFRGLIEAAADGVIVVVGDGTIAFANPAACAADGSRARTSWRAGPSASRSSPASRPRSTSLVPTARSGSPRCGRPPTDWRGQPAHLAALRDVTERKRAEESAREALSTLRSFYDGAPMMMGVVELLDDDIRYVSSNAATAALLGRPADRSTARPPAGLGVPPAILALWIDRYREAERVKAPVRFEYRARRPDGPGLAFGHRRLHRPGTRRSIPSSRSSSRTSPSGNESRRP